MTLARAKAARKNTIGSYYRLRPVLTDFHAAIGEAGIIVVSAKVHGNWLNPEKGKIQYNKELPQTGGHAFAIVGYNEKGFWVQNSWDTDWGNNGLALWSYEDWIDNVMDAWVFRMALPIPQIFGKSPLSSKLVQADDKTESIFKPKVKRSDIAGHFVHADDSVFAKPDRYWSDANDIKIAAENFANSDKYEHLLIYGHGGLNSPADSANRILAMKETFKSNGIYPFHVMYDTGLTEEIKDVLWKKGRRSNEMAGGFFDWTDKILEHLVARPGTLLWDEMKRDAKQAFRHKKGFTGAGFEALQIFLNAIESSGKQKKYHIVGHSTGAILFAHMLNIFSDHHISFNNVFLLAPACKLSLYNETYLPILNRRKKFKN